MKLFFTSILLFFIIFSFGQIVTTVNLNDNWTFEKTGKWYSAKVPGSIYIDLFKNKLIADPFFGDNEKNLQWIEQQTWKYQRFFTLDAKLLKKKHIELEFEGLDTYAKIYVNDSLIMIADNMFCNWHTEIKQYLKEGENKLEVEFLPVSEISKLEASKIPYKLPEQDRAFVRKAQYQFGWDWAPRMAGCGIWKSVKINIWSFFRIENVQIVQNKLTDKQADLTAILEVNSDEETELLTHVTDRNSGNRLIYNQQKIVKGLNKIKIDFKIENPKLWWCNGMGEPYLYHLFIETTDNKERWDHADVSVGLRTIKVIQKPDNNGSSFYFELNGVPVFAKGANYIPANYFPSESDSIDYDRIISDAVKSNMNMLRVWGGGIYENDLFYDLCDRKGIMIWQDFMFAGAMYPGSRLFTESVKQEAIDNVKRLRNHPSIALWCGNNEVSEAWHNWGWQKQYKYSKADSTKIWNDYINLFHNVLSSVITFNDSSRFYWTSSPLIGWGRKESLLTGDCHYWGVWWGMEPFDIYKIKVGRFMSEYGFQGIPNLRSIEQFIEKSDRQENSPVMKSHQKHPTGYETIASYLDSSYIKPINFEDWIYKSQLLQADGIKIAIEAHRRAKPYCMGTLYWQMNDCCPVVSWAGIDYYGRWKAMQYMVKKAYRNVSLSVVEEKENLLVYAVSDSLKPLKKQLKLQLISFNGKVLLEQDLTIEIPANSSNQVFEIPTASLLKGIARDSVVFTAKFADEKKQNTACFYFAKPKNLLLSKPNINVEYESFKGGYILHLKSNCLAKSLCLNIAADDVLLDDNYFDLLPNETYYIRCQTKLSLKELKLKLSLTSLNN